MEKLFNEKSFNSFVFSVSDVMRFTGMVWPVPRARLWCAVLCCMSAPVISGNFVTENLWPKIT